jgi:ATP-dependent Clp protease ATP-binding subunit ClpC
VRLIVGLSQKSGKSKDKLDIEAKDVLRIAFRIAADYGHYSIDTEHLLMACLSSESLLSYSIIGQVGVDPEQIKDQINSIFHNLSDMDDMIRTQPEDVHEENFDDIEPMMPPVPPAPSDFNQMPQAQKVFANKGQKALEYFAIDLVERARKKEIDPVWGRDQEIGRAIQILLRKTKNNPVFVGDPGVGKTAIVEGIAQKIAANDVPNKLLNKKLYQLDLGLMIAGTMYRGQFEERLKKVINEIKEDKNVIVFIDELHSIIGAGSAEGSMDAANILKPSLAKGELRLIGATTYDEYRKHLEKDAALERRLQIIQVKEPTVEETIGILTGLKKSYEDHHDIKIDQSAIIAAARLSDKYINYRFLPDKAIDLIDEAASALVIREQSQIDDSRLRALKEKLNKITSLKERLISEEKFEQAAKVKTEEVKLQKEERELEQMTAKPEKSLTDKDIAHLISEITAIPVGDLLEDESKKFQTIESELQKHIAGQTKAIEEIAKALKRSRSGLGNNIRPIGSFIFLGPSGVGKTEVAKVLARHIYGSENSLIKIDMSEFMERHNTARLVGAPAGYVGYEDAGRLTEAVKKNPYSIILFDEIEKAHPDIFNLLLQILDEGKLTDARGQVINFANTIIIMTSNIGIDEYKKNMKIGFSLDESIRLDAAKGRVKESLSNVFRPELINRIDRVVVFDQLSKENLADIAKIHIQETLEKLKNLQIKLKISKAVATVLSNKEFDPIYGARPIIRAIEELIENPISELIITGKIKKGDGITIETDKDEIVVRKS